MFMTVIKTRVQNCLRLLSQCECNTVYDCYHNVSVTMFMTVIKRECKTVYDCYHTVSVTMFMTVIKTRVQNCLRLLSQCECNTVYDCYHNVSVTMFMTVIKRECKTV